MPEGDAVHRLARTFGDLFVGRSIHVWSPQGRFATSAARIDGQTMVGARAVGKHMFLGFAPDEEVPEPLLEWIHIHLGLYGSWRFAGDETFTAPSHIGAPRTPGWAIQASGSTHRPDRWTTAGDSATWQVPEPVGQVRVRLETVHGVADLSGPTRCDLVDDRERQRVEAALGPDPLAVGAAQDAVARNRFVEGVRRRRRAVGELVMDQSVAAGIGNIYRAEGLFLAGISPLRTGNRVGRDRLERLWMIECELMTHGLEAGRIETVSPEDAPDPELPGDPQASRFYVYHRSGRPCLQCGTPIRERIMQGRRLFWCARCQR